MYKLLYCFLTTRQYYLSTYVWVVGRGCCCITIPENWTILHRKYRYFFGPIIPRVALFKHFLERFVVKKSEKEREIKRKSTRSNGSWTYIYIIHTLYLERPSSDRLLRTQVCHQSAARERLLSFRVYGFGHRFANQFDDGVVCT